MSFNVNKCKVMHTGTNNINYDYSMHGQSLDRVTEHKDLGKKTFKKSPVAILYQIGAWMFYLDTCCIYRWTDIVGACNSLAARQGEGKQSGKCLTTSVRPTHSNALPVSSRPLSPCVVLVLLLQHLIKLAGRSWPGSDFDVTRKTGSQLQVSDLFATC